MTLLEAGMITIVSMLIVFIVLTCLMVALNLIHRILSSREDHHG